MKNIRFKPIFISSAVLMISFLILSNFASASGCPSTTEVRSNQATLVGNVTNDGGDPNLTVWFQYGTTINYGNETSHISHYGTGSFCQDIYNLTPCTTYYYRAIAKNSAGQSYGENKTFTTLCNSYSAPTVDIKANGSDGPISLSYNSSVTLSWTSSNATSCTAYNGWSGSKAISGSETVGNLTSSRTYTIVCNGLNGQTATDSVTVNIASTVTLTVYKTVRNLSDGTGYSKEINADPGEILSFSIIVKAGNGKADNVIVKDILPKGMNFQAGTLKIDGVVSNGNIQTGLDIGSLSSNQQKVITFNAQVASADNFAYGQTVLVNSASATGTGVSTANSAEVIVTRKAVKGATTVSTGLTNNIFFDSFAIPLAMALILLWTLKANILKLEEWVDRRKESYRKYKARKILGMKIKKIKVEEALKKINS